MFLCLTETHSQGSFVTESLDGYKMFKRNRHISYTNYSQIAKGNCGGVAMYVRSHLRVQEKQYIQNVKDLEFMVIKVEAPVNALIAAVYRPPDYNVWNIPVKPGKPLKLFRDHGLSPSYSLWRFQ